MISNSRGKLSATHIIILYEKQSGKCPYCGDNLIDLALAEGNNIAVDHIVPLCSGGKSEFGNYAIACSWCNWHKRRRSADEFLEYMRPYRENERYLQKEDIAGYNRYMYGDGVGNE